MYNVAIIGCGSIGALKPDEFDGPGTEYPLTLAHAFYNHPDFDILGFVDPDAEKTSKSVEKWCGIGESFAADDIEELSGLCDGIGEVVDVAVIATPTETHSTVFKEVMEHLNPKIVMMEKPVGVSKADCLEIKCYRDPVKKPVVGVNYSRRYVSGLMGIKRALKDREVYSAVFYYNRGLYRDGCHAIDFLHYLFGKPERIRVLDYSIEDYGPDDPTLTVHLEFPGCRNVFLLPIDGREVSLFELDIFHSGGAVGFYENGVKVYHRCLKTSDWGNYQSLMSSAFPETTPLKSSLYNYVDEAAEILKGRRKAFSCTIDDALAVHETIERIHERNGHRQKFKVIGEAIVQERENQKLQQEIEGLWPIN